MNLLSYPLAFGGDVLQLTNQRAVFWPSQRALLLGDLHLGKPAHFRKNGIAVPKLVTESDLERLEYLLDYYRAQQVIILGDLIHAAENSEFALFRELTLRSSETAFILVRGNHDRIRKGQLEALGLAAIHTSLQLNNIVLTHDASNLSDDASLSAAKQNMARISAHIHPGVLLYMPSRHKLKFPCYLMDDGLAQLVLPAFSQFTGLDTRTTISRKGKRIGFHESGFFHVDF